MIRTTKLIVRSGLRLPLAIAFSLSLAVSQIPGGAPAEPARPLRERLLERALKGDAEAQFELAKHYEGGRIGLPQDYLKAAHWYWQAAAQGDAFAEASLGIFYNFGKGVPRDYFRAFVWFERSATHLTGGDRESVIEMREAVGKKLNPTQIAEARRLAQQKAGPALER